MPFATGSIVSARGRQWVVLPDSTDDLLLLRPLGGSDDESTGIFIGKGSDGLPFEEVKSAGFKLPDPSTQQGNHRSSVLLRDAVRLGFRSAAGPFRSLARIAVEPRPYQLVPLLLALRLDPVRLMIADDVGIGKTIEACLIARELLDRGEVKRICVLCPPHLAEQWQKALREQFHIEATLVLSGTAARLERHLPAGRSLFEVHPFCVVSTDYIKQERRRDEFLRACPELVLVDEAHTCADSQSRGASQRRYALLRKLSEDPSRHLILISATPHSGNPETFRSLLSLLHPEFQELPEDLGGEVNRKHREKLAEHLIQRRRGDIKAYLDTITPFPERDIAEDFYSLKPKYRDFFDKILKYCRESVAEAGGDKYRQRVRWWSALALLRSLSSSPKAAASTLRNRSASAQSESIELADEEGRRAVMDLDDESAEGLDVAPGVQEDENEEESKASPQRRRLLSLAQEAEKLCGAEDQKLIKALEIIAEFIKQGLSPIVFCRFIPTVDYLAHALRERLPKDVNVEAVSGLLPAEEREKRVEALSKYSKRVLVCTDCLSEGINLQHAFDSVLHYDLSWNPTRHEQREGRVDRYGQEKSRVKTLTYFGRDNPVDGIVIDVLLKKHKNIRNQLGVAVPVPMAGDMVEQAIQEGLLMKDARAGQQLGFDFQGPNYQAFGIAWDAAVEREKKSRAIFAQHPLQKMVNEELFAELGEVRRAIGSDRDVQAFVLEGLKELKATLSGKDPYQVSVAQCSAAARDAIGQDKDFRMVFQGHAKDGALLIGRTHPLVEGLAAHILESALDPALGGPGRRCAVIRTQDIQVRTTLILARMRFHLDVRDREGKPRALLAEDLALSGFEGSPDENKWLDSQALEKLLQAQPHGNLNEDLSRLQLQKILEPEPWAMHIQPHLQKEAQARGKALLDAHKRVRRVVKSKDRTAHIQAVNEPDVLGLFIYLPMLGGAQ